jgi:hypothetical protein
MPGKNLEVVGKPHDLFAQGVIHVGGGRIGQVGAANAAFEEDVTGEGHGVADQHDAARRMAGGVFDDQAHFPNVECVFMLVEPKIRNGGHVFGVE